MRTYLLPEGGHFYKVNMHSHSTLSDGRQTPEELKEAYLEMGYSAIAFTEHGELHDLNYLTDERFVAIKSYEIDFIEKSHPTFTAYEGAVMTNDHAEAVHMNFYAKRPDIVERVRKTPIKEFRIENFNAAIRRAKELGYLTVYNHPNWSMNTHELYSKLEGLDGIEIVNGGSNRSSDNDYAPAVYDQMARAGKRLICVGGDDNHGTRHFGLAWTMVKAPALSYADLMENLEAGNCYASDGPEICELYMEDDHVILTCSPAKGVFLTTAGRRKEARLSENGAPPITTAKFRIRPEDHFFRLTVRDEHGKHANTRFYYLDELK